VGEAAEHAAEVGRLVESSADLAPTIANLWIFNIARGRLDRAEEISADLFRIARELDDPQILLQAHHCAWPTRWLRGQFAEAATHVDAGLALYDEERHAHHRYIYLGHDPAVCGLNHGAIVRWVLGYPDSATRLADEAVTLARRLRHAPSLAQALVRGCETRAVRGDFAAVIVAATEALELSEERGLPQAKAEALIFLGWALTRCGETIGHRTQSRKRVAQALSRVRQAPDRRFAVKHPR